ncbi:hypothetical protein B5M42_004975 [Paenibacillus athensensis]|uniref:Lipoprotein n=1 Tax=Paenibacillus athensensis TaxID=1967502 RepID=A0A4Y8PUY4_9BACL|nr:hypothetical protein [Paenibacillus athensensis]MCD1258191.1 hypothetical protein [Paenibacillus athensensis]
MSKTKKTLIFDNLILLAALFTACTHLYFDIERLLTYLQYAHASIKKVTYAYFNIVVYTDHDTFQIHLWIPLLISGSGIIYNLTYSLIRYLKGE